MPIFITCKQYKENRYKAAWRDQSQEQFIEQIQNRKVGDDVNVGAVLLKPEEPIPELAEPEPTYRFTREYDPTNPMHRVCDVRAISAVCKRHGALLEVDNTLMSPLLSSPLKLGADIVVHSATKFCCGHSDTMAGVVCVDDPAPGDGRPNAAASAAGAGGVCGRCVGRAASRASAKPPPTPSGRPNVDASSASTSGRSSGRGARRGGSPVRAEE